MNKRCLIVLINYKSAKHTTSCLESLKNVTYKNFEIYLIDNNSGGEDVRILEDFISNYPLRVHFIVNEENLGFAKAANMGFRFALDRDFDYVLLLNNDTTVEPDFLEKLIDSAESEKDVGIVSGKILFKDGKTVFSLGGEISFLKNVGHLLHYRRSVDEVSHIREDFYCSFVSGCLMLVKREVIEDVGFLDGSFFMYIEDVDFCYRVLSRGWKIRVNPKSVIYHTEGASSSSEFSAYWGSLNRLRFIYKHFNGLDRLKKLSLYILSKPVLYAKLRNLSVIKADLKGVFDFYSALSKNGFG